MAVSSGMGSALALAKSSLAPRVYKTGPPNYYTQTSFSKRLDVSANLLINDSGLGASAYEKVPTSTGLIIWQPNRGAGSIYRYGIVPQGASSTAGVHGLGLFTMVAGTPTLSYGSATAVPYSQTVTADVLKISPDLSQSFSQVRVFSGDLRVICDTVPIGNTALNGYFSAGSMSDSRDVSQVSEGTGNPANCFDPSDLVQTSVTSKEGLKEISVMKGIITLVGSDIQPFYAPPQTDETDVINAGWTTYQNTGMNMAPINAGGGLTSGAASGVGSLFVSPWNVGLIDGGAAAIGVTVHNVNTGPINLNGVLDFQIITGFTPNPNGPQALTAVTFVGPALSLMVTVSHIFATCTSGPTWSVTYLSQQENYKYPFHDNGLTAFTEQVCEFDFNPRMFQQGLTSTGMYIGTQINTYIINEGLGTTTADAAQMVYQTAQVRARSLYNQGELGPIRVIRWDGLSDNQQIKVDGVINAQCIPEGNIAPFVQNSAMFSDTAHNLNTITFLAELYNGDSPIRRNWTLEEYIEFMKRQFPDLSPDMIMSWNQPKLQGVAEAAGVFEEIGSKLGGVLGGMGGNLLGSMFGAEGDFAGDGTMGYNSGGSQFLTGCDPTNRQYSGSAAGQFPTASGQFPTAAGQFMASKRGRYGGY